MILQKAHGELHNEVLHILHEHDPIAIGYLPDEYEPEVGTILPRLKEAQSPPELAAIVHAEFVRWFGAENAGPQSQYSAAAQEIWAAYQYFLHTTDPDATD